ncbi:SARP family transcriptional regulator [Sphaerisporangium rufum]|uniref:SARP family transcriptional regulator n=1 Tax=Sphaerisporangium rufum TaxID=1381558 RepID=A0A919RBK1_9ACTN|nr:BTAD domain-containing putative transcriptional regulator [Sphaerisporangium rufum]GII80945.1 SARP family transcriptional regulator [Sphaerisporangium rufum]
MRFGVLGPLAVWTADGTLVPVPGLKVRALLADLLVHQGRPVPADRLIDDLWGDDPPGNPPAALSAKVSQLRRVLEDAEPGARELVEHHPAGYLLKAETDGDRFAGLLAEAARAADPRDRAARLAEALAGWRGPAFADFADEPFVQATAARLAEQRLTAFEDWAETRLELGDHAALAAELGDLLAEHPLRERLRAAHMRALYRSGRQSEALDSYERLRTLLADELGLDPGAELAALHQAILAQEPALAAPPPPARPVTNLPEAVTGLIGRDAALDDIRDRLHHDRLVTLTGPGGVGKTRLAAEAARRDAAAFPDGVWFVDLAALEPTTGEHAAPGPAEAVLAVLGVRDAAEPGESPDGTGRLVAALRPRRALLLLDNCEHVVEPVAELADRLLRETTGIRVLATSQEPLGLPGEVVWSVPPLEVPGPEAGPDELARTASVRLFAARAAAADRTFRLDEDTAPAVAVLCRRLDGIPLALELAATRVRALGVHGLVDRLNDRFRLLAAGHRGAPPRQRTLLAMIDWSWELLTAAERVVLRRLAVHADGCTMEAAEAVCAGDDSDLDVLDLLARLVDRSLVVRAAGPDGPRYRLLESVAAYCADRLQEAGETGELRRRHRRHYARLAAAAEPELRGPGQHRRLRLLDAEAANLRAALNAAVRDGAADDALRLVNGLAWFWFLRGRLGEARRSLAAALALPGGDGAARARALAWDTGIAFLAGDAAGRPDRCRAALAAFDGAGDPLGRARAEWFLAYTRTDLGDLAAAEELLGRALPAFETAGDRWGIAAALAARAKLAHVRGDLPALRRDGERSLHLFQELGDPWGQLEAGGWLAGLAEIDGDLGRAEELHRGGLRMAEELGMWTEFAGRLSWLGWLAVQRGDHAAALEMCERALRLATEQGHQSGQIFATIGLAFAARRQGRVDLAEAHLDDLLRRTPPEEAAAAPPPYLPLVRTELGFVAEARGDARASFAAHLAALDAAACFDTERGLAIALDGLAGALSLAGRNDVAARLLGAAAAGRAAAAQPSSGVDRADIDRITGRVRDRLGEERFAAEFGQGGSLTLAQTRELATAVFPPDR